MRDVDEIPGACVILLVSCRDREDTVDDIEGFVFDVVSVQRRATARRNGGLDQCHGPARPLSADLDCVQVAIEPDAPPLTAPEVLCRGLDVGGPLTFRKAHDTLLATAGAIALALRRMPSPRTVFRRESPGRFGRPW